MKYPQLNSLVPAGEHFDESAVNEGVFLSVAHIDAIEQNLAGHEGVLQAVQTQLDTAKETNTTHEATIVTHEATISTLTTENKNQSDKILELQGIVAKLNKKPSGQGSSLQVAAAAEVKEEEKLSENGKARFDSADHPANKFADSVKKYDSGIPPKK